MTEKDVIVEVQQIIRDHQSASGGPIEAQSVVQELMGRHEEDKDFALLAAYFFCQRLVKLALRRREVEEEGDPQARQATLPGFQHLQATYSITRDGKQQLVLVSEMTDAELDAKTEEHRKLAKGNSQHADELQRYKAERRPRRQA